MQYEGALRLHNTQCALRFMKATALLPLQFTPRAGVRALERVTGLRYAVSLPKL